MNFPRLLACLGLVAGWAAARADVAERENNAWPFRVASPLVAGRAPAESAAGPIWFTQGQAGEPGGTVRGVRPFWVEFRGPSGEVQAAHFLYPLFNYTAYRESYRWDIFQLVRRWNRLPGAPAPTSDFDDREEAEVFPFWFSRQGPDAATTYRGLFPIYGTVKRKLGIERLSWTLFPLYVENERNGAVTTSTPWPFIRVTRGAAQGWAVWPLYGQVNRPGVAQHTFALWPFFYRSIREPDPESPAGTPRHESVGALPFFARSTGPGYVSQDYLWPFFGYSERTQPKVYREQRYLWPFFVQGRGDNVVVNRWAPFYTHSVRSGAEKTWIAWPLVRQANWVDEGVARDRSQFLYFLYWHERQRAAGRAQSPEAHLLHVWPLLSSWDNGAGRRQWQALSPLEVFFPRNQAVRHAWSPLFALARHDQQAPGHTRTSVLWNAITYDRRDSEQRRELHVGPLLSVTREGAARRIALGRGLVGFNRNAAGSWRIFWGEFPSAPSAPAAPAHPPVSR